MSTSRIITASTAIALGATALVAPSSYAATVGAKDAEAHCKVTYTDAEQKAAESQAQLKSGYYKSLYNAVNRVFPGAKKILTQVGEEPTSKDLARVAAEGLGWFSSVYGSPDAVSKEKSDDFDARLELALKAAKPVIEGYEDQLVALGMERDGAKSLAWTAALVSENFPAATESKVISAFVSGDREEVKKGTSADKLANRQIDSLAKDMGLSVTQKETFRKAFLTDTVKKYFEAEAAWDSAYNRARLACLDGGNITVAYPTEVLRANPFDAFSVDGSSEGSSSESTDGKLSPGAIAGIVIGVLAVLGVAAVFAAPMLGIQLPFALPQLPF